MFDKMIMMRWIVIREVVLAYKSEHNRLDICFWLALLLTVTQFHTIHTAEELTQITFPLIYLYPMRTSLKCSKMCLIVLSVGNRYASFPRIDNAKNW